jgi:hypothetical protein
MTWLGALWLASGLLAEVGPAGLMVGAAVLAGVMLAAVLAARWALRAMAGHGPRVTGAVLSRRDERTGTPRQRDPDASGRPRPRAPAAAPAAA